MKLYFTESNFFELNNTLVDAMKVFNVELDYDFDFDNDEDFFIAVDRQTGAQYACHQAEPVDPFTGCRTCEAIKLADDEYIEDCDKQYETEFDYLDGITDLSDDDVTVSEYSSLTECGLDVTERDITYRGRSAVVFDADSTFDFFESYNDFEGVLDATGNTRLAAYVCGCRYVYYDNYSKTTLYFK